MNTRSMAICCTTVKVVRVRKLVKLQSTSPIRSNEVVCTLDPGASLSFVTPYVVMNFDVRLEKLLKPFNVSTLVGESVLAETVYQDSTISVNHKSIMDDLVELDMVDFDVILDIGIKDSLSYEEIHVQILDRQVRKLRTREVASVTVLWRNQFVEEVSRGVEEDMKKRYPHLFESGDIPDQGINSLLSTL
ncbi:hypothetical protein MTR67_044657 [Solanum verrucosum]|uniref:Uncharacterized protein n=1 Tax=Solanum verrucosum TaxID=315347 RepID=A0AAF0ZT38_SOLVR|nr:hypothetical protein MTR67_044657 [Solanum verrucosum]